jgi:ubiquinone/menaquinone biosynthesis C-methylase UbiE
MRRALVMVGAGAALAGVAALVVRSRGSIPEDVQLGAPPGRQVSRFNTWSNRPAYRQVADDLELGPDDALLDVGCGWGGFLVEHGSRVRSVAGLDRSAEKVRLARERLAERITEGTAEVVLGDAGALPWEDGRFSAVACIDAFQFFPDPVQALAEMRRVLRPGGRAVINMGMKFAERAESRALPGSRSERPCDVRKLGDRIERIRTWTDPEVHRMMEAAGFEDVSISYDPVFGDSRLGNRLSRALSGTDELRHVRGVKPLPVRPADDMRAEEPVAVG